jgi:ketosteroid isomerase-like protein
VDGNGSKNKRTQIMSYQGEMRMAENLAPAGSDRSVLEQLNREYVDAFMNADVQWYRDHLAEEFVVIESDGSILNKDEFLKNTAKGPDVTGYVLQDVDVRIYGDTALVRATGVWTRQDGSMGMSRYIDVYVKTQAQWKTVSAQITRSLRTGPRGRYKRAK